MKTHTKINLINKYIKLKIALILPIIFYSCNSNNSDSHIKNFSRGRVISEFIQREKTSITVNYDDNGNFISFSLIDENIDVIVNINDNSVVSYSIEDDRYFKLTNLSGSNVMQSIEKTPLGEIETRYSDGSTGMLINGNINMEFVENWSDKAP